MGIVEDCMDFRLGKRSGSRVRRRRRRSGRRGLEQDVEGRGGMKRNMRMMVMGRGEGKQVVACGLSVTSWCLRCLTELPKELAP